MKQITSHYVELKLDLHEVFSGLEELATKDLISQDEVFAKGVVLCKTCLARNIQVQNKYVSVNILRSSIPTLIRHPEYLTLAKERGVVGNSRGTTGMFRLVAAIVNAAVGYVKDRFSILTQEGRIFPRSFRNSGIIQVESFRTKR